MKLVMLAFSSAMLGCGGESFDTRQGIVSAVRVPCTGEAYGLCTVLEPDGVMYEGIEGYEHRWGIESEIVYHIEPVANPPADGSSIRYVLDEIVRETPRPGLEFELAFPGTRPGATWFEGTGSPLDLKGMRVLCESALCSELLARQVDAMTVELMLTDDPDTLQALAVR